MITGSEMKALLNRFPKFEDSCIGLEYAPRLPKGIVGETKELIAYARKFNDEVIRPRVLVLDRETFEDPGYLPHDIMKTASDWGFYTMWVPRLFGGRGKNLPSLTYTIEEISAACAGIANVIGVHFLGVTSLMTSFNMKLTAKILKETVEGEKKGEPCLISFGLTEPMAGTDVEEMDLVDRGKVVTHAKRVDGGYLVNGRKVFISMGHMSEWTAFYAYTDMKKPSKSMIGLAVRKGTKGFSLGRHEDKMGQRVCPASEIIFEDCFIPDEDVMIDSYSMKKFTKKSADAIMMRHIDYLASATKAGVCAISVGVARGALEDAIKYASETTVAGRLLINHEWVQCILAEMYKNVILGRLAYTEANNANAHRGTYEMLQVKPAYYYLKYMPDAYFRMIAPMLEKPFSTWAMSKMYLDRKPDKDVFLTSGMSSLAKFAGSDFGIRNCQLALEIMGQEGLRHDRGMEKRLRDCKVLQIYEGSNQMNRVALFKNLIAPSYPQARVWGESAREVL